MSLIPNIVWPLPCDDAGLEFESLEAILSRLSMESTGTYVIGSNGMWHGGIHITSVTAPWCALTGKAPSEITDFPEPYKGKHSLRCMADGEVVAYRICKDYLTLPWQGKTLSVSGSFLLVRHALQTDSKATPLNFYTLYMHLAPHSAYDAEMSKNKWITQNTVVWYASVEQIQGLESSKVLIAGKKEGSVGRDKRISWDPQDKSKVFIHEDRTYGLVTLDEICGIVKEGQQVWIQTENNNIRPAPGAMPSWWKNLLPPSSVSMVFDTVVCPAKPYKIKAGDPVGHLGYYQAAKDGGAESRYQVHIECLSADDMDAFVNKAPQAEQSPFYLKYEEGVGLYQKDVEAGTFSLDGSKTKRTGVLALSELEHDADKLTGIEYTLLPQENGFIPKKGAGKKLLSQFALGELGFATINEPSKTFDHLDGKNQPKGMVYSLFKLLEKASKNDSRISHALVPYNYQRLIKKIDSDEDAYFPQEYLSAIHNPSYQDVIQRAVVKHPSEWYYKKDGEIWKPYLDGLKKDAPEWKAFSETFIDKMAWMQDVKSEKLQPEMWHMHPLAFLGIFKNRERLIWIKKVENKYGSEIAEAFRQKVMTVAGTLSIKPGDLMACLALDSGREFDPAFSEGEKGAVGLIQFSEQTAKSLGTTTAALKGMSLVDQMDYVGKYIADVVKKENAEASQWSLKQLYLSICAPYAINHNNEKQLTLTQLRREQLKGGDAGYKGGDPTVADIEAIIQRYYDDGLNYSG